MTADEAAAPAAALQIVSCRLLGDYWTIG